MLRIRRTALDFMAILLAVATLLATVIVAGWQFWHVNRIYTGVSVAGVPVGGMTRAAALAYLSRELSPYPVQPVMLTDGRQRWPLATARLEVRSDLMDAVNRAYLVGRQGSLPGGLRAQWWAFFAGADIAPVVAFDPGQVHYLVSQVAAEVRRPGRPATQMGDVSLPARPGLDVDVEATAQAVMAALQDGHSATVPLRTIVLPSPDSGQRGQPEANPMGRYPDPLVLAHSGSGLKFALDPAVLERMILSRDPLRLDETMLRDIVNEWALQVVIPAQDARLRFDAATGAVSVRQPSVVGRRLDVEATIENVRLALANGQTATVLPVQRVAPAVDMNRVAEMGIRELVASASTYFAGSSRARIHNIEVAAAKFEGVVVPPGAVFSFNKLLEDVSAANGFEDSLIIWGDRTAVGVGGGVCQVSTTVFRAALYGGFPIVERYNHGYVVSWYGEPGMDATIYTPTVDFRFRNDTDAYLLIEPVVDSRAGVITFQFYGTRPNRQVTIGQPQIGDVVEPGEPIYQVDDALAQGERKQVEYAKRGMTVTVERTVVDGNGQSRVDTFVSRYQPWQAVYLVGPGTEVPTTPTPTPEPSTAEAATP